MKFPSALSLPTLTALAAAWMLSLPVIASDAGHGGAHAAPAAKAGAAKDKPEKSEKADKPEKGRPEPGSEAALEPLRERLAKRLDEVRTRQETVRITNTARTPARPKAAAAGHGGEHGPVVAAAAAPAAQAMAPAGAHGHGAVHWSYGGEGGPAEWGGLKPEFVTCKLGSRQSPIDIRGSIRVDLEPIRFEYHPSAFSVVDNGHTVQANIQGSNSIEVGGRRYDLLQFHFHRPSEERINGRQYDMVVHLVHKDPEGRLAVVAVMLEQGRAQPAVQMVWNALPLEKNLEAGAPAPMDLNLLLPEDRRYYTYMGSLTTPPCTEGVLWLVLKQPVPIAPEQVGIFARLYPMNARPIQPASGRLIKESN